MKFRKSGQVLLAAAATVVVGLGLTSCGASNTVDFLYVTSSKNNPGQINVYIVDSESGAARQIADSPYPSGGRNPVADVASPNGKNLYVANHDDNTLVEFVIGTDGKLYPQHTCNTPGTEPSAMAISPDGSLLYVVDFYQAGFTDVNPGPGALAVYHIQSDGSLGNPITSSSGATTGDCNSIANGNLSYWPLGYYPGNVAAAPNGSLVYVADPNIFVTTVTPPTNGTVPIVPGLPGQIYGFTVGSGGTLGTVAGSPFTTASGSEPLGVAVSPDNSGLFVTDTAQNQLLNYVIGAGGALSANPSSPTTPTGTFPVGVVLSSDGSDLYVSNFTDGTVSEYTVSNGVPALNGSSSTLAVGHSPTALLIDPSLNEFLFTPNFVDGTISGARVNTTNGTLVNNQNSPYVTSGQPTSVAAIPHNQHAVSK
ncbi:lactonase family protein [Paracidobacterium acidisoli]|uniref:Uncharacterized protein n=1 Tax=Paracidobacterium acidisoli TaxID=2303751 RepID=A0A372IQG4_9BACT|nr:beta-propeller fold lactonase family protein [Paracidobacterium acidisoli]MBT9331337.1 lactonase family protein [Paracidobacterium acidisoli]